MQARRENDWQPYEPMFTLYTQDGEEVREPVMRRQSAGGRWEYRRMTPAEAKLYERGHNRGARSGERFQ